MSEWHLPVSSLGWRQRVTQVTTCKEKTLLTSLISGELPSTCSRRVPFFLRRTPLPSGYLVRRGHSPGPRPSCLWTAAAQGLRHRTLTAAAVWLDLGRSECPMPQRTRAWALSERLRTNALCCLHRDLGRAAERGASVCSPVKQGPGTRCVGGQGAGVGMLGGSCRSLVSPCIVAP